MSCKDIADTLDANVRCVYNKAVYLGLRKERIWDVERIRYLVENYATTDNKTLADNIGKSVAAINKKASLLGLKKAKSYLCDLRIHNLKPFGKDRVLTKEEVEKIHTRRRESIRIDKIRLKYGLPQRTKIKLTNIY